MSTAQAAVFRDYGRAALDAQYNNRKRFPGHIERFAAWAKWSEETRARLDARLDIAFGPTPKERLDVFPAARAGAPVVMFVHGGYWYSLDKSDYSFTAAGLVPNGVACVVNNYTLAPDADMDEIVRQNRAACAWIWRHAGEFGWDPERIFVAGHSAGGHLAAMMLATDWPGFEAGLPPGLVKGASAISGLFELEPIRLTYLNDTLRMDAGMAERNSPLMQSYPRPAPLLLVLGEDESEEYHRQSHDMAAAWRRLDYRCELIVPKGLDHFTIVDSLKDPKSDLTRRHVALANGLQVA